MKKIILLLAMVSACGVPQPSNQEVEPPPDTNEATEIIVLEWNDRLGEAFRVEDLPSVHWFTGNCLDYGDGDPGCVTGGHSDSLFGESEIHLIVYPTIHESALAHEVLHWAIGDADHLKPEWKTHLPGVEETLALSGY